MPAGRRARDCHHQVLAPEHHQALAMELALAQACPVLAPAPALADQAEVTSQQG